MNIARIELGIEHEITVILAKVGAEDIWSELEDYEEEEEEDYFDEADYDAHEGEGDELPNCDEL